MARNNFVASSIYEIQPSQQTYVVSQGEAWSLDVYADGPYGCDAMYDVSKPSRGLRVQIRRGSVHIQLETDRVWLCFITSHCATNNVFSHKFR